MKQVTNLGNMPLFLKTFLLGIQQGESKHTVVYDCHYDEIVKKAQEEKLEPQVLIDRKNTGRAFLCALGASVREIITLYDNGPRLKPVFYFAELDEVRKKQYQEELRIARAEVIRKHREKLEVDKRLKEAAREGAERLRNEQARSN